jgi:hypothetical protein
MPRGGIAMKLISRWATSGLLLLLMGVPIAQTQAKEFQIGVAGAVSTAGEVASPEALVAAVYAAISGPAGERDWAHFRTLFLPDARFTRTRPQPDGTRSVTSMSVDDFINTAGDYFKKEGFYESAVVNRVFGYGRMVDVLSSYESRHALGEKPFARGTNSMQMISDGKRWWMVSIAWDDERADNPMPKEFLK